jgi:hypothetical protein
MAKLDVDRKQPVVAMDHGRAMGAVDGGPSLYRQDRLRNTRWNLLHAFEDARVHEALGMLR